MARRCNAEGCTNYTARRVVDHEDAAKFCRSHQDELANGAHAALPPLEDLARFGRRMPEGWRERAACADVATDVMAWFPKKDVRKHVAPEVRALCRDCPVRAECIAETFHFDAEDNAGYRAGTVGADREALRASLVDLGRLAPREDEDQEEREVPTAYVPEALVPSAEEEYLESLEDDGFYFANPSDVFVDSWDEGAVAVPA